MTAAPGSPGWTATMVVERSWRLARANFAPFFMVCLMFSLPVLVADLIGLGLIALLVHLVCTVAAAICLTCGALHAMAGHRQNLESLLRELRRPNMTALLLLGVIQLFVVALSAVVIVPPFFLVPLWAVTIPAMLIERLDVAGAFWRSADLTRYRRLHILGAYLLWLLIILAIGAVVALALDLLGDDSLSVIGLWLLGVAAATILHLLPPIFYVLLRGEQEGVGIQEIARALD